MVAQDRTAGSFYSSPSWLPEIPSFQDPFEKADAFLASSFLNDSPSNSTVPGCPLVKSQEQQATSESSAASSSSSFNRQSSFSPSVCPSSRQSPVASSSSSSSNLWKSYNIPGPCNGSSTSPSAGPSPLSSRRTSLEAISNPDNIQVVPPPSSLSTKTQSRRNSVMSLSGSSTVNRLCMQLKPEHVMYEEVIKGQLPEIALMKSKLSRALPLLAHSESHLLEPEMSIRIMESTPYYLVQGTILLESRKASWKKHSKLLDSEDDGSKRRSLPELTGIDPWELPIDGSSLLVLGATKGGKKTFEFPQYRTNATCRKCHDGFTDCGRCGGLDAVDCFWCGSTGYFKGHKCKKCKTTGQINCIKCDNSGKVKCTSCDGKGAFKWALCVELKMDSLTLPIITSDDLFDAGENVSPNKLVELIKRKATHSIHQIATQIFEKSISDNKSLGRERRVPVLASCHVEKHMKRLLHVSRWDRLQSNNVEHSRFVFTADGEEKLVRLAFTMDQRESERLRQLDEREHKRLQNYGMRTSVAAS